MYYVAYSYITLLKFNRLSVKVLINATVTFYYIFV